MRFTGRLVTTLGVVVFATTTLGIAGCNKKPSATATPDVVATGTPDPIEQSKEQYTGALERAKAWQSNAELARVYRQYDGTLVPSEPAPLVYGFSSLADPKMTFEVEHQGDNIVDRTVARKPFELLFNPIDVSLWKVPPDEALKIAEDAGGKAFRDKHLAGYAVLQQLSKVGAFPLQWYFRYDSGDSSRQRLEIYINATSGAVDSQKQTKFR